MELTRPVGGRVRRLGRGRPAGPRGALFPVVCALPVFAFLILPTALIIPMAFTSRRYLEFPPSGFSSKPFQDFVEDAAWTNAAVTSLKVAAIAVGLACLVGATAAVGLHGAKFRGKGVVVGLIIAPLVVPLVVLGLADFQFLARYQLVGSVLGIGLAHSVIAAPYAYLTVDASLTGLDPALVRSARSLGAGNMAVFRHVYLPVIRPGLLAGAMFAFAVSFDEAVIALFLQGPDAITLPVKMFTAIQFELSPKIAAVASLLIGMATLVLLLQVVVLLRRRARPNAPTGELPLAGSA